MHLIIILNFVSLLSCIFQAPLQVPQPIQKYKMESTDPNFNNITDTNEPAVSVINLKSRLWRLFKEHFPPGFLRKVLSKSHVWRLFKEHFPPGFLRKVVAEIIATYLLVFVTCGSAALSASDEHKVSKLGESVAGGLIVTVMIYTVGHISGAHMNPAVTLAFAAVRHFPWKQVPIYAAAQLTGAISAAFTLHLLLHPITNVGTTSPSGTENQALVMEIVVTFSMMFLISAVATDAKAVGELAGIAVGSAVCITSILAGPISGGSMNPARTIGPAIAGGYYKGVWVYLVGPISGTLLGAWSYNLIRVTEPVQATSSRSSLLKFGRSMSKDGDAPDKDPLNSL